MLSLIDFLKRVVVLTEKIYVEIENVKYIIIC